LERRKKKRQIERTDNPKLLSSSQLNLQRRQQQQQQQLSDFDPRSKIHRRRRGRGRCRSVQPLKVSKKRSHKAQTHGAKQMARRASGQKVSPGQ